MGSEMCIRDRDYFFVVYHGDFIGGMSLSVNFLVLLDVFIAIVDDVYDLSLSVEQCSLIGREILEKYGWCVRSV